MKIPKIWITLALSTLVAIADAEAQTTPKAPAVEKPATKSGTKAGVNKAASPKNRIEKTYTRRIITTDGKEAEISPNEIKTRITIVEGSGKNKWVLDTTFATSAESAQVKDFLDAHTPSTKGGDTNRTKPDKRRIKTIVRQYRSDGDEVSTTIRKSGYPDLAESLAQIGSELEIQGLETELKGVMQELGGLTEGVGEEVELAFGNKKKGRQRVERRIIRRNDIQTDMSDLDLENEDENEGMDGDEVIVIRVPKIKRLRKSGHHRGDGQPELHFFHHQDGQEEPMAPGLPMLPSPEGRSESYQYHGPMGVRPKVKTYRYEFRSDDQNAPSAQKLEKLRSNRGLMERNVPNIDLNERRIIVNRGRRSAQILMLDTVVRGSIVKEVPKSDLRNALAKADISITPQGPGSLDLEVNSASGEPLKVVVATIDGKELVNTLLYKQSGMFSTELDLGQSAQGTYLIQLSQGKETMTKKVKVGR